jgi:hypothetical protein
MSMSEINQNTKADKGILGDKSVAENFRKENEPVDLNADVDQRARLKRVGGDQSSGEDALTNSLGDSLPRENPSVGAKS